VTWETIRTLVQGAGHFLEKDRGEEVTERIVAFLKRSE
jgi:hypothetical protein